MPRRSVVVAAALVAVLAAAVVWFVAAPETSNGSSSAANGAGGLVLRSTAPIAAGIPGEDLQALGLVEFVAAGSVEVPDFPVVSFDSLTGTVTSTAIDGGVVLASEMFVSPVASLSGLTARLEPGHTGVAVTVDATRAVGGWLRPGDRVNILVPSLCPETSSLSADAASGDLEVRCRRVRYLYQAVLVVAVGPEVASVTVSDGNLVPQSGAATLVLSLPPRAAQWVASYENDLWFTLVPPLYEPRAIGPLPVLVDRLPGEQPGLLTPDCSDPADPVPAANPANGRTAACGLGLDEVGEQ